MNVATLRLKPIIIMLLSVMSGVNAGFADDSMSQQDVDLMWYCREVDSGGLRYHAGRWALTSFTLSSGAVAQRGDQLDLSKFGMSPDSTHCRLDGLAGIISCSDHYTLFNLNVSTGKAAMAHALGWVNQAAGAESPTNDMSVTALHCRGLRQIPQWSEKPPKLSE